MTLKRLVGLAAVALTVTACSGGDPAVLDWDLTESHTIEGIGRADDGEGGGGFDSVESVRITLPDGSVFEATDDVAGITFLATDGELSHLDIAFEPETAEDTYTRILGFINEWELTLHPRVDSWWAQAQGVTGPEAAEVDTSEIFAARPGDFDDVRLAPGGPFIDASIAYSFNDDRPFAVNFGFTW